MPLPGLLDRWQLLLFRGNQLKSWAGRAAEALMHGSVPGKHGGGGGGGGEV